MWTLPKMLPKSGNVLFKLTLVLIFSSGNKIICLLEHNQDYLLSRVHCYFLTLKILADRKQERRTRGFVILLKMFRHLTLDSLIFFFTQTFL